MSRPRFRSGAVALAGVAAIVTADAAAGAEEQERLKFSVSRAQTVGFSLDSSSPWSTARVFLTLPAGTAWNGRRFPRCSIRMLNDRRKVAADGVSSKCPRGSRVGSGHATIVHENPSVTIPERIRVTVVNGGPTVHLVMFGRFDVTANGRRLQGKRSVVWRGRPPNQGQVTAWVPVSDPIQLASDRAARLVHLDLKIGDTRRTRGILELPRCKGGRWRATAQIDYWDINDPENERRGAGRATDSVRC
jgi:hypothetical protein